MNLQLFLVVWSITDQGIGQNERQGGGFMWYDRDQIPKFAQKDYVFLILLLFLKKQAFWRRAWSLEISRGRLATPNARFRPCPTTRAADIAYQRHRLSATSQVYKHTAVRPRCCVTQLGGVKHIRFPYLSTFNPIQIVCKYEFLLITMTLLHILRMGGPCQLISEKVGANAEFF